MVGAATPVTPADRRERRHCHHGQRGVDRLLDRRVRPGGGGGHPLAFGTQERGPVAAHGMRQVARTKHCCSAPRSVFRYSLLLNKSKIINVRRSSRLGRCLLLLRSSAALQ